MGEQVVNGEKKKKLLKQSKTVKYSREENKQTNSLSAKQSLETSIIFYTLFFCLVSVLLSNGVSSATKHHFKLTSPIKLSRG